MPPDSTEPACGPAHTDSTGALCARHAPRAASGAAADEEDDEEEDEADAGARKRRTDASQLPVASVAASSHASDEMPSVGEESASGEPNREDEDEDEAILNRETRALLPFLLFKLCRAR